LQVRLAFEQEPQTVAHYGVIVGQENANHFYVTSFS